jgi:hypothetical protein
MLGEDALDSVSSELVTEVAERATDPGVAPAREMWSFTFSDLCEADEYVDIGRHRRATP